MGILGSLFGGSKQSSASTNKSYDFLQGALGDTVGKGVNFFDRLGDELAGGFDGFKKKAGFDFQLGEGLRGITGGRAAMGALRSGDTGKDYVRFGNNLQSGMYGNYLDRLGGMSDKAMQAAGILAGAGQESTSKGKSSNGILNTLFSDRRMKEDIKRIGTADNGLPIYSFTYKHDPHGTTHIGFMADEVKDMHPDVVVRDLTGFDMVDYGKAVL